MKKLLLSFGAFLLMSFATMAQPFNVTFNVDMHGSGLAAAEAVYMAGDFGAAIGTWQEPGTNPALQLLDADGDSIYTVVLSLDAVTVPFKFFKGAGWAGGEWAGDPNRSIIVAAESTVDAEFGTLVTFNVNMASAGLAGEPVYVAGDFLGGIHGTWNEPGSNANNELKDADGDGIYSINLNIKSGTYAFKFFKAAGWAGGEWTGDPNRSFTFAGTVAKTFIWAVLNPPVADFEDGTTGALTLHVMGNGAWDDPLAHAVEETFMVIDNPAPDAMNSSAKVMKFIRRGTTNGGQPWGGFWANLAPEVDVTVNKYVHVKVWKSRISPVKLKLEGGAAGTLELAAVNAQQLTSAWEEFVFDFSEKTGTYPILAFMPDFEDPLTITDDIEIFFDDIVVNDNPNTSNGIPTNTSAYRVYPNPVNNTLFVENSNGLKMIRVYSITGQLVNSFDYSNTNTATLNFNDLNNGMYILSVTDGAGKVITSKVNKF
jgi:hypothetical protein